MELLGDQPVEQGRGYGGESEALLHDLRRHKESGCDRFLVLTLAHCYEGEKLVEGVQGYALHVLRQRVILCEDLGRGIP